MTSTVQALGGNFFDGKWKNMKNWPGGEKIDRTCEKLARRGKVYGKWKFGQVGEKMMENWKIQAGGKICYGKIEKFGKVGKNFKEKGENLDTAAAAGDHQLYRVQIMNI